MTLPQVVPVVSSEVSLHELAKSSEKEQLEKEASFIDSENPTELPPVVPSPDQIATEELAVASSKALFVIDSSKDLAVEVVSDSETEQPLELNFMK